MQVNRKASPQCRASPCRLPLIPVFALSLSCTISKSVELYRNMKSGLYRGVSSRQRWPLLRGVLTSGVAFIEGCPHVRGGLYEGCPHVRGGLY